jgi:hypothetical protein
VPPQATIQSFQRRQQKKKGGIGSVLGILTGAAAVPGAKDALGAAGRKVFGDRLDQSLAGAGKAIDTTQTIAKAASGPALMVAGAGGPGGTVPPPQAGGLSSAASAAESLSDDDAVENLGNLREGLNALKTRPEIERRQYTKTFLDGISAISAAKPNAVKRLADINRRMREQSMQQSMLQQIGTAQQGPQGLGGIQIRQGGF